MNKEYEKLLRDDYMHITHNGNLDLFIGKGCCSDCIDIAYTGYNFQKLDIINTGLALRKFISHMEDGNYCISMVDLNKGEPKASAFISILNGRTTRIYDTYGSHKKVMTLLSIYKIL